MESNELRAHLKMIQGLLETVREVVSQQSMTIQGLQNQIAELRGSTALTSRKSSDQSAEAGKGRASLLQGREEEFLHDVIDKSMTIDELREKWGVSHNTITRWMVQQGLGPAKKREGSKVPQILELVRAGRFADEIAEEMGVAKTYVYQVAKKNGVKIRKALIGSRNDVDYVKMDGMIKNGHTAKHIAKIIGCSESTVYSRMRHNTTLNEGNVRTELRMNATPDIGK